MNSWVDLRSAGYNPQRAASFRDALVDRLQSVSGIESVAWLRSVPFDYRGYASGTVAVDGYEFRPDEQTTVDYNEVGPGYLATTGISLVSGREFTRADNETSAPVAIVNETMAAQYWRDRDPVGTRVQLKGKSLQVVGVARTSKYRNVQEPAKSFLYIPMRQGNGGLNLMIRTSLPIGSVTTALTREVRALDPNLVPGELLTTREQVDRTTAP